MTLVPIHIESIHFCHFQTNLILHIEDKLPIQNPKYQAFWQVALHRTPIENLFLLPVFLSFYDVLLQTLFPLNSFTALHLQNMWLRAIVPWTTATRAWGSSETPSLVNVHQGKGKRQFQSTQARCTPTVHREIIVTFHR